jgi:predicted PurR-regulated permease PerM
MEQSNLNTSNFSTQKIIDTLIQLVLLFALISWCFTVIKPFFLVLIWGAIIAIAVYPVYIRIVKIFRGRRIISAVIVAVLMFSLIILPGWFITESVFTGVNTIRENIQAGQPLIPPPGEFVRNWPSFTKPFINFWQHASDNLQEAILEHQDQVTTIGAWFFSALSGLGKGIFQFVISIALAAILLIFSATLNEAALKIFNKITPVYGKTFLTLSVDTVGTVIKGVIGVAAIQAVMAGIAFFIVGIPFAGVWTIICLVLSMVQIGSWPILLPMAIYMFSTQDTITASLFAGWMIVVVMTDNVLTPLLMGRGSSVPMLVIFIGTIGGFMAIGFLGLFMGAVTLSIAYKLFVAWLNEGGES